MEVEVSDLLKQNPFFSELTDADIAAIAESTRMETHPAGHVIIREGRVGAAFYIIVSGKVEVIKGIGGAEPIVVATLDRGDFFGEVSVMKHIARSASVKALTETHCLVVRRLDLDSYLERYPGIAAKISSALSARFGDS